MSVKKASTAKKPRKTVKPAAAKKAVARKGVAKKPVAAVKAPARRPAPARKKAVPSFYELDRKMAEGIADVLVQFNAKDVERVDLKDVFPAANFFVIATSNSAAHGRGVSDKIRETVKETLRQLPHHIEGYQGGQWIILDYLGVVVHIFSQSMRDRYDLESLWKGKISHHENS